MADIKVRVGAQHDRRATDICMADMAASIRRANSTIESQSRQTGKRMSEDEKRSAKDRVAAEKEAAREISAIMRRQESDGRRASAATARDRIADIKRVQREEERANRQSQRERERFAYRTSQRFTRFLFPRPEGMLGYGKRVGTDMLRGLGYDLSISSSLERVRSQREAAMGISQQERIATGKSRGTAYYQSSAEKTGNALDMDPEQISKMTRAFTGLTGEFDEAVKLQEQLASIGGASGAALDHIGEAAGNIYNAFRGMPNAGKSTIEVLRGVVHQTASGAIEMKDYAARIGQVAAVARRLPGDVAKNIGTLSALTQFSILGGGGNISAAQAATSMRALMSVFTSKKRVSQVNALGGTHVYDSKGDLNNPLDIMASAIVSSKGDMRKIAPAFGNVRAITELQALLNTYKAAGGGGKGGAGEKAMYREIAKLGGGMTAEQEKQNNADRMAISGAQRFKNAMDVAGKDLLEKLGPAAEKLAPAFVMLATKSGQIAAFFTDHWAAGIAAAIGIAVGRAFAESLLRQGIDRFLAGRPGASPTGTVGGVLPRGGRSNVGGAALVGLTAGLVVADQVLDQFNARAGAANDIGKGVDSAQGLYGADAKKKAAELRADYNKRRYEMGQGEAWQQQGATGLAYNFKRNIGRIFGGTDTDKDMAALRNMISILDQRAQWTGSTKVGASFRHDVKNATMRPEDIGQATANALQNTTIPVRVTNPQPANGSPLGSANVDASGRQAPVGQRPAA